MKDTQSRKYLLTINNPISVGITHDTIKEQISQLKSCIYYCMSDEIGGKEKTYRTHIFIAFSSAVRFSTIKNKFKTAHIDFAKGSCQEIKDYVFKEGKWENTKKSETNLKDTHYGYGEMPIERQGQRNDLSDLYDMIKSGSSNFDILEASPDYILQIEKLDKVRQTVHNEQFKSQFRQLEVTYIYGGTETGKTRTVMERYGYENIFRLTNYLHGGFDSYKGQDVIIFEEFCSSFKIQDMLNYLDGYPVDLPCRYINRVACYTKVYIITNIDLLDQYQGIQENSPRTWAAFLRRIHKVVVYHDVNVFTEYSISEYLDNYWDIMRKIRERKKSSE